MCPDRISSVSNPPLGPIIEYGIFTAIFSMTAQWRVVPRRKWKLGSKMKYLMTALVLLLVATPGFAQGKLEFPSLGAKILEKQFPQFDKTNVTLTSLRKYRTELEYFRDEVLEGYNKAVSEYVAELGEFDKRLELARKNGAISESDYQRMHERVADEYNNAGANGDLLKPYFTYLKKYQSEATFVINEINNKEKELIRF
jgi:hypothetical protein